MIWALWFVLLILVGYGVYTGMVLLQLREDVRKLRLKLVDKAVSAAANIGIDEDDDEHVAALFTNKELTWSSTRHSHTHQSPLNAK